jgi:hypothetical protein
MDLDLGMALEFRKCVINREDFRGTWLEGQAGYCARRFEGQKERRFSAGRLSVQNLDS